MSRAIVARLALELVMGGGSRTRLLMAVAPTALMRWTMTSMTKMLTSNDILAAVGSRGVVACELLDTRLNSGDVVV